MKNTAIILYDYTRLGGVQKVTCNLANLFVENNFPLELIISFKAEKRCQYNYPPYLKICLLDSNTSLSEIIRKHGIENVIIQVEDLKWSTEIAGIVSGLGCNVYYVLHNTPLYWLKKYYTFKHLLKSPRAAFQYLKFYLYWKPMHYKLFKLIIDRYYVVCVSETAELELLKAMDVSTKPNICYIYNPLSISNERIKPIFEEKQKMIVYAGRMSYDKRVMYLLKAWKKIYKTYPDWELYVLGDGPEYSRLTSFMKQHSLQNVYMPGSVNNVEDYLRKSRISVLLSMYEGLPTCILEAISYRNAIIGTKSDGGIHDLLKDNYNGVVLNILNVDTLTEALCKLMNDDQLCETMGNNSSQLYYSILCKDIINSWRSILK